MKRLEPQSKTEAKYTALFTIESDKNGLDFGIASFVEDLKSVQNARLYGLTANFDVSVDNRGVRLRISSLIRKKGPTQTPWEILPASLAIVFARWCPSTGFARWA